MLNQIGSPVPPKQQGIQLGIAKTARKGISCRISYTKKSGQFNVYDVQRYSFRQHKGVTYFYGWDLKSNGIKSFIADNISNVTQLATPHRRLWVVQMGNDPQQVDYWQKQRLKTEQQKAAQEARQEALQQAQDIRTEIQQNVEQIQDDQIQQMERRRQMAMKDMNAVQRIRDQRGKFMSRQDLQFDDDIEPIIRTIRRNVEPFTPDQYGPDNQERPFGVV